MEGCGSLEKDRVLSPQGERSILMSVNYLNPEGLHRNPAFSHVVTVEGSHRTVYVGC